MERPYLLWYNTILGEETGNESFSSHHGFQNIFRPKAAIRPLFLTDRNEILI